MKKELNEKLCADFPKLFADRNGDMQETCMCWGFECGDGWEPLIRKAAEKLEALNALLIDDPAYYIRASQIKEKYGTLRFYLNGVLTQYADAAYAATDEAETQSETTCETCGEVGKIRGGGWVYTACDAHTREEDLK